ncbi:MOFRL family protein [Candidatus Nitrosopumilus salaria BD31]|uniref:MOFRL family protein n=1 Tax=Candidatus Nitrosopumilus salarius BD31 TaxID=859350 RepID=I3D2R8_9ARCH|nr:MOFRL family protein [Candidatus Nitrosopumilus salaria BD31]
MATTDKKKECLQILEAGLQAANPENIIPKYVTPTQIKINDKVFDISKYSNIYSVAFGKAGDSMTRALNAIIPIKSGIVVIPKGSKSIIKGKKFQIFNSRHPKPDQTSVKAAKEVMKFVQNKRGDELIIFLVSGGGSSLLAMPDNITLDDKIHVTNVLLKSGATIQEFNCIRKHLSKIKGGKLVENMKCDGISLVMSDVEGDDLSSIASGTTYMDDTTYADALEILDKYKLKWKIPIEVLQVLEKGAKNEKLESSKKSKIENFIIANNSDCLEAMKKTAEQIGYTVDIMQIFGDLKDAVKEILEKISESEKTCLIFGGETTVKVLGKGMGGRNQELVLRMLKNSRRSKPMVIASIGTDGIDGNSVFAGAITENIKIDLDIMKEFLKNSDSGRFFQKQKGNIVTNFTHTNLMDIGVILR